MTNPTTPPDVYATGGQRAAAVLIDLAVLMVLLIMTSGLPNFGGALPVFIALLYLVGLPLTPLRGTAGKWICRIRLSDPQGGPLHWRAAVLRGGATVAWFTLPAVVSALSDSAGRAFLDIWLIAFLLPWASIGFRPRRESLFDLLAGSRVVRIRADPQGIAAAETVSPAGTARRWLGGLGLLALCLGLGASAHTMTSVYKSRSMHGRMAYAIGQTLELRTRIEEFHTRTQRWPTGAEMDIPTGVPYRDGGSYRVDGPGRIVITFSVLPELKGRSLVFTPTPAAPGDRYAWACRADEGLDRAYLPAMCR